MPRHHCTPEEALNENVLRVLKKHTHIGDFDSWVRIWLLISKGEHDNDKEEGTFEIEGHKGSVFGYASELSYDKHTRGCTMGLVGWTSTQDGPGLFKTYKDLGGEDLVDVCRHGGKKLLQTVHRLGSDPLFIQAQWENLCEKHGYIHETMKTFRHIGIHRPSPLAIAVLLDCNLNQGFDGKFGGSRNMEKVAVHGDEETSLKRFLEWRKPIAGTHDFNHPRENGENRVAMFQKLVHDKNFDLHDTHSLRKALAWRMK